VSRFPITLDDVRQAAERMRDVVRPTPLLRSDSFSAMAGCTVYLKAENLQVTGSFKIRGAANKIACLSLEERARGVVAASMGNHAQGVAYAATHFGVHATVVMPAIAPLSKYRATQSYGAEVILHGDSFEESLAAAQRIVRETGAVFIHAYDDWDIIAGQGTLALDILRELPDADALVGVAAERARTRLALTYPQERGWIRAGLRLVNGWLVLRRCGFRVYGHRVARIDAAAERAGLRLERRVRHGLLWESAAYARD